MNGKLQMVIMNEKRRKDHLRSKLRLNKNQKSLCD